MRLSSKGRSVYAEVGFWMQEDGSIHLTMPEVPGFHIGINPEAGRSNGHPTLYKRLAACLRQMGAPAPAEDAIMPKAPRGERSPDDVIGAAIRVGRVATGDEQDDVPKRSAAAKLGKKGGEARAKNLTPEARQEIARKGAARRWGKG